MQEQNEMKEKLINSKKGFMRTTGLITGYPKTTATTSTTKPDPFN